MILPGPVDDIIMLRYMKRKTSPASYGNPLAIALVGGISSIFSSLFGGGKSSQSQGSTIVYPPGTNYVPLILLGVVIVGIVGIASIGGGGSTIITTGGK